MNIPDKIQSQQTPLILEPISPSVGETPEVTRSALISAMQGRFCALVGERCGVLEFHASGPSPWGVRIRTRSGASRGWWNLKGAAAGHVLQLFAERRIVPCGAQLLGGTAFCLKPG